MEMFDQERKNDKSTEDFYTLSGTTVKFQRFDVPTEGLPLLEKILSKQPNFMSKCTYGNAVRKVTFKSLVAVLLDIERTPLKSLNLHKVLEWKDVLSELRSMRFDVGFILDWLKTTAASCIVRDGEMKLAELTVKIADLEKEIKTIPLAKPKGFHHVVLSHQWWLLLCGNPWRLIGLGYSCFSLYIYFLINIVFCGQFRWDVICT